MQVTIRFSWPKTNVDRYRRVQRFVETFFPKIAEFGKPPRHSKWREVNLAAELPGWTRFEAAQAWLDNNQRVTQSGSAQAEPVDRRMGASNIPQQNDVELFQEFLRWKRMRQGR